MAPPAAASARKLDILVLSLMFPPDGVSTAHIMGELAVDLRACGHRVRVLTTTPHYSVDSVARASQPMTRIFGNLVMRSDFDGVQVTHIKMPQKRGGIGRRLASWLWFHAVAAVIGILMRPRPGVVLVPSPLLSLAVVAWLINLGRGAKYVYNVQELYPDLAINSGYVKSRFAIGVLCWLERFVYQHAAAVTTIGPTMRRRIAARVPERPVVVIPNPADIDSMRPLARKNDFARVHHLNEHFVVTYAGNMGLMQGLDDVLAAAELMRECSNVVYLFVGEGVVASALHESAAARGLPNVRFLPQQPYSLVPEIYATSDVCLVPLIGAIACEAIPSKVARIMACGRPALAIAPADSDLAKLVTSVGCGAVAQPGMPQDLAEAIARLAADPALRQAMGERGRAYACSHLSRSAVAAAYDSLIRGVA